MAEDRYDGTTGEGAEQNALSECGERTVRDKAENPIENTESEVRRFRPPQPEIPDIGESNPCGVWAIGRKTVTYRKEPVAMDKSVKKSDDSMRFPTLTPETMVVGPERPREPLEEEDGGVKTSVTRTREASQSETTDSEVRIPDRSQIGQDR